MRSTQHVILGASAVALGCFSCASAGSERKPNSSDEPKAEVAEASVEPADVAAESPRWTRPRFRRSGFFATPAAITMPAGQGVLYVTAASCSHAASCRAVGPGRKYPSSDDCAWDVNDKAERRIGLDECFSGLIPKRVEECLEAIERQTCGPSYDPFVDLPACDPDRLCAD